MSRTVKFIFTISIILNLVFIGLAGAYFVKSERYHFSRKEDVKEKLSPEGKALMEQTFKDGMKDMRQSFEDARAARHDVLVSLQADEFDPATYDEAIANMNIVMDRMIDKKISKTKELAEKLSDEDRKLMAEYLAYGFGGDHYKKMGPYKRFKHSDRAKSADRPQPRD